MKNTKIKTKNYKTQPQNPHQSTNVHLGISYSNFRKSKLKKKIMKEVRVKKHLTYRGTKIRITLNFSSENVQTRKV